MARSIGTIAQLPCNARRNFFQTYVRRCEVVSLWKSRNGSNRIFFRVHRDPPWPLKCWATCSWSQFLEHTKTIHNSQSIPLVSEHRSGPDTSLFKGIFITLLLWNHSGFTLGRTFLLSSAVSCFIVSAALAGKTHTCRDRFVHCCLLLWKQVNIWLYLPHALMDFNQSWVICNMGTLTCWWGQRSHIKVKGHLRSSCKIGWKCESGLIWKVEVWAIGTIIMLSESSIYIAIYNHTL